MNQIVRLNIRPPAARQAARAVGRRPDRAGPLEGAAPARAARPAQRTPGEAPGAAADALAQGDDADDRRPEGQVAEPGRRVDGGRDGLGGVEQVVDPVDLGAGPLDGVTQLAHQRHGLAPERVEGLASSRRVRSRACTTRAIATITAIITTDRITAARSPAVHRGGASWRQKTSGKRSSP